MSSQRLPIINIISFAQNAEDVILYRAFKDSSSGTYVDLGAGHPLLGSLTKNLADRLHWKGVEVEANKELCELLSKYRPNSTVLHCAVSDQEGTEKFTFSKNNWAMSALSETADDLQFNKENDLVTENIKVKSLNVILQEFNVFPDFELLKVDVEGAETKVFKGFDFKYWRPKVVVTEIVTPYEFRKLDLLKDLIESQGYKEALFDGLNSFFVRNDQKDLIEKIRIPANIHDKYIPYIWWNLLPLEIKEKYPDLCMEIQEHGDSI